MTIEKTIYKSELRLIEYGYVINCWLHMIRKNGNIVQEIIIQDK